MPPTIPSRGGPSSARGKAVEKKRFSGVGGKAPMGTGGKVGAKRHRKIMKDCIKGITKPAIRRLARRGGVKRISAMIYEDARHALKARLEMILRDVVTYTEYRGAKTVTVNDVIFALRRIGRPIYGFDPETYSAPKGGEKRKAITRESQNMDED
ncbi:histone-fold-containing protein [Apiosordaria backusii]|uniref:Histone H4 n=1 Tax=Apiosordaria backusii TaxID=314023 RepID=A0AA40EMS3_9PEZI|nr:histone-fold-containing protein [Apiosordaria backusii]